MMTNIKLYGTEDDVVSFGRILAKLGVAQQEAEVINRMLSDYDFRVDVPVEISASSYGVRVTFTIPEEVTEKDQHLLIADVVRVFGVKLERKFSEGYGKFSFIGTAKSLAFGMDVMIDITDAKASNCKITAITEMKPVTRYVSDCSGGKEPEVQPEPVGEQVSE